ncbi:hypothetical protein TWF696_007042 [Orbilia brochopaga]|uniref:Sfi1 spindle body domain-containing protein n=1 Tax=Orbilia brochopaga TaxID=3140254 RepID=A0AAV9UQM1_9PEZI
MPLDHQTNIFGVKRPLPSRVDLSRQEIELLREIVTYASVIPETTPWNALFHAYDVILRRKGIDAALDDRCFRFLMRLAEVQGTSWYDRYATLLSMWHYEVPPKAPSSAMNDPPSFSSGHISANIGPITITFKGASKAAGRDGHALRVAAPNPRIQPLDDEDDEDVGIPAPKVAAAGKENIRVNNGRSSPHPSLLQRRKLPPSDDEKRKREELEKMKAEFAFPTSLFETTSEAGRSLPTDEAEPYITRASFLNDEDFEDQNDENDSPEHTAYIPPIRNKANLIAAAEKAVVRYNNRQIAFVRDIIRYWRSRAYRIVDYHQLQWDLACSKDQRVLSSQVLDIWRVALYWRDLERRVVLQRQQAILARCLDLWRMKAVVKARRKETINRNILMRKVFRAWKAQAQSTQEKLRRFQLASHLRKWRQRLAHNRALQDIAQQRYDRDLKYRAYWTLFYGFCNIRAPQINELRLKRSAILLMRSRLASLKENERVADDLYCFSLLKRYLRMWHGDLTWIREIAAKADEERRYMLLYKGVLTWRREARFAPLVRQQQENHDANQSTALLALWRNRLRQIKAADHVKKINVLKTTLRSWRLHLRLRSHEKYVKSVYLSTWFDKYSAALADRCHQFHMWRRWLENWRGHLRSVREAERIADDVASITVHAKLKLAGVQVLRAKLSRIQELEDKADQFRRGKLLNAAFNHLIRKREELDQMRTWSASAACYFGAQKYLKVWRQTMEKHKRHHRKEAYNQVVRNRSLRIKAQAFNALLAKHDSIAALDVTAQDFFESGCKVQASTFLNKWTERLRDAQELQSRAVEFRNAQLKENGLDALIRKLQSVYDLYHLAETYNEISRRDKVAGVFKKLRNTLFHQKLESVKADMFRERAEANRQKAMFRMWHWRCRERLEQRQVNDQFDREFALEDQRHLEDQRQQELVETQLAREQQIISHRRSRIGDRSIVGPEGLSMLDVSEWIKSNSASAPAAPPSTVSRIPQTPSARAAKARAFLESRNSAAQISRLKLVSTTPAASPSRKFSRSIAPFRRSISGRTDMRFTQSLSSRLREEIKEDDELDQSTAFLTRIDWDENEQLPNVDEAEDENAKTSGSTTAVATQGSPGR